MQKFKCLLPSSFTFRTFSGSILPKFQFCNCENALHIGDPTINNAFGYYSPVFLESLLLWMQPEIENKTGKKLHPTYSYGRIYGHGSELERHTDRPSGEYGVTCCLEKQCNFPIFFEREGHTVEIELDVGDICIYKGIDYPHWREPYQGTRHIQVFLMYVDSKGLYQDWKWDKRPSLCQPPN